MPLPTSTPIADLERQTRGEGVASPTTLLEKKVTNDENAGANVPIWQRCLIVFTTSWLTLAACFSSTSLLTAAVEIAHEFDTTAEIINITTGALMFAMGSSSFLWSPISRILGRKIAYNSCILFLLAFTIGAALSPDISAFTILRILSGLQGTFFHVAGQTILAENFPPLQRGRATGFFLAGSVLGPPLGPFVAGIILKYQSWRVILWLQSAMIGVGFVLSLLFIPHSPLDRGIINDGLSWKTLAPFNPVPTLKLLTYPNILLTDVSCGLLAWSQYSLLSSPRSILVDRFGLNSPLLTGLYYIAPAAGFLAGTTIGGWHSDRTVVRWIEKRGVRLPQDRLNSGLLSFFVVVPVATLVYGWGLQCNACTAHMAGLALPVITAFIIAAGLLMAFASLNTYCAEAIPSKRPRVIATKYFVQYSASAVAVASTTPMVDSIGIGATSTIGVVFVLIGGILVVVVAKRGLEMQRWRELK